MHLDTKAVTQHTAHNNQLHVCVHVHMCVRACLGFMVSVEEDAALATVVQRTSSVAHQQQQPQQQQQQDRDTKRERECVCVCAVTVTVSVTVTVCVCPAFPAHDCPLQNVSPVTVTVTNEFSA